MSEYILLGFEYPSPGRIVSYRDVIVDRYQNAGKGRRLVADTPLARPLDLELFGSKTFGSGAIALHYRKK